MRELEDYALVIVKGTLTTQWYEKDIIEYTEKGWELLGSPFSNNGCIYQALVKYKEEPKYRLEDVYPLSPDYIKCKYGD